jgi:hypothetical protein
MAGCCKVKSARKAFGAGGKIFSIKNGTLKRFFGSVAKLVALAATNAERANARRKAAFRM